jgi:hypothetical protein
VAVAVAELLAEAEVDAEVGPQRDALAVDEPLVVWPRLGETVEDPGDRVAELVRGEGLMDSECDAPVADTDAVRVAVLVGWREADSVGETVAEAVRVHVVEATAVEVPETVAVGIVEVMVGVSVAHPAAPRRRVRSTYGVAQATQSPPEGPPHATQLGATVRRMAAAVSPLQQKLPRHAPERHSPCAGNRPHSCCPHAAPPGFRGRHCAAATVNRGGTRR